jgi:hypothetical protein
MKNLLDKPNLKSIPKEHLTGTSPKLVSHEKEGKSKKLSPTIGN